MLHQGQVVLDVSGEERSRMDVPDLLHMFEKVRGEKTLGRCVAAQLSALKIRAVSAYFIDNSGF